MPQLRTWTRIPVVVLAAALVIPALAGAQAPSSYPAPSQPAYAQPPAAQQGYVQPQEPATPPAPAP
ncbi:hypothetical protein ACLESO_38530, partial [Pyxidicoccus sp. 3LG]